MKKIIICFGFICSIAYSDYGDYKKYQADFNLCKRQIETRLLESPEFSGGVWEANNRAHLACRNKLGDPPESLAYYEKNFANRVNEISPQSWDVESIIEAASMRAKKYQSSFIGFGNSYGEEEQVSSIAEVLLSSNMACYTKSASSFSDMVDMMEESRSKKYQECEEGIKKAILEYVRSYNLISE